MSTTVDTNLITLTRHTLADQKDHEESKGDLTLLLVSIQVRFAVQSPHFWSK